MGRPLNKKFFGDASGRIAGSGYFTGGGAPEACFIVKQKSNLKYLCTDETDATTEVLTLVQGTPAAEGELQIQVTPENAVTPVQATVTITQTAGVIDTVVIANAGYGYWAAGTGVSIAGGTGGTLDYTVSNGSLASVVLNAAGTGYSDSTQNIGDAPAANPPVQSARIINARTVKTFEGNTFDWPITAPLGAGPSGLTQADLGTQA